MKDELQSLLAKKSNDLEPWVIGNIPKHYKRITVSNKKAIELAKLGAKEIFKHFGIKLYFSQALLAGAILSDEFDDFVVVSASQWGKSFTLGRVAVLRAFYGRPVYIAGASQDLASIIMQYAIQGVKEASDEIRGALINRKDQIDRLSTSISKTRIAFSTGGFVEAISLADTYQDSIARNKAVGKGGDFFVDEASLVSDEAFSEMGRREFARKDGEKYQMVMISNPHNPGGFYDELIEENPPKRKFILWMDALTALEEGNFTEKQILESKWAKNRHDRTKYLLCELDIGSDSMFEQPKLYDGSYENQFSQCFIGLDSAYRGKDNITVALNIVDEDGVSHIDEVIIVDKGEWIDGVTGERIVDDIIRICDKLRVTLVCADIGQGIWLVEGINRKRPGLCKGIGFGERPTRERVRAGHYGATHARRKRDEMHLDLQNLIEDNMIYFSTQAWNSVKDVFPFISASIKPDGKYEVIKKSEVKAKIGKSPDELDAVLLSIQAPMILGTIA